ncbi:MAG: hydroxyacylglutathione hydrolase [Thermomicrobiales bacterium]|nr:hydroxyacylglutathione hydrolase [Thermomicrobiales bacterium]
MKLTSDVALVGSGSFGFDLSSPADAHLYLIDGGDELALVDAGCGGAIGDTNLILRNIANDGYDTSRISKLLLTHYHFDHMGGAAEVQEALGVPVHASPLTARVLEAGDEEAISLPAVKAIGFVPEDYHLRSCPATGDMVDCATFRIGRLTATVIETPGHADGHVSFLVEGGERVYLIQGDLVFFGGTILLQNVPDCSIELYGESVRKLAGIEFEAFLPGHGPISLRNGKRHVDAAAGQFAKLMVPRNWG